MQEEYTTHDNGYASRHSLLGSFEEVKEKERMEANFLFSAN